MCIDSHKHTHTHTHTHWHTDMCTWWDSLAGVCSFISAMHNAWCSVVQAESSGPVVRWQGKWANVTRAENPQAWLTLVPFSLSPETLRTLRPSFCVGFCRKRMCVCVCVCCVQCAVRRLGADKRVGWKTITSTPSSSSVSFCFQCLWHVYSPPPNCPHTNFNIYHFSMQLHILRAAVKRY